MAIDFGKLDQYKDVPAGELKDKIRGIAYEAVNQIMELTDTDEKASFFEKVDGVVFLTGLICETIDEEVAHAEAEAQLALQRYEEAKKRAGGS